MIRQIIKAYPNGAYPEKPKDFQSETPETTELPDARIGEGILANPSWG